MAFKITICDGDADKIVVAVLKELTKDLKSQLKRRKRSEGCAVFELDQAADLIEIEKRIVNFKLTLEYFGELA